VPGLDEFYRYLDNQEKTRDGETATLATGSANDEAPTVAAGATGDGDADESGVLRSRRPAMMPLPGSAEPGVRYVLRGGVTVAVPADEATIAEPVREVKPSNVESLRRAVLEAAAATAADAAEPAAPEYIPPIIEAHEPTQVADAPTRPRGAVRGKVGDERDPLLSDADILELWQTLPRHIQLLVGMKTEEQEEVAQKYYTRNFKESRAQLIERLLDPTLTLEDTARVLGVCPTTVRRYTNRNVLPHYRTVGQQRRFRLSDVLAFLERQQHARRRRAEKTAAVLSARNGGAPAAPAEDAAGA
jgi:excisionase family DNA binding protein